MKTERQQAAAAAAFAQRWKGRGYERGESQPFWIDLLSNVYGIETPSDGFISFEDHRMVDASNFIDGRIPSTKVLIEQKSLGKDLRAGIRQSDGSLLNPFQQARRYVVSLPVSEHPRWIVTCNFAEFLVYDMEQPNGEPQQILFGESGQGVLPTAVPGGCQERTPVEGAVCGRLEMRYRYSKDVVYNNFPWPNPTDEQRTKVEQTAQAILDARALYPNSSLADLYDELTMPVELRRAHQDNDRAVMAAYGFPVKTMTESQCVAELFKLYQQLAK